MRAGENGSPVASRVKFRVLSHPFASIEVRLHAYRLSLLDMASSATTLDSAHAKEPFSSNSNADIIIRSSNNVDFFVLKSILSVASPLFADMFALPQKQNNANDPSPSSLSRIPVTEDDRIIDAIFRICYPIASPPVDLIQAEGILEAGRKYQMEAVTQYAGEEVMKVVETDPIAVYYLACRFGLKEKAEVAARTALRFAFPDMLSKHKVWFDRIPGAASRSLLNYHFQCCRASADTTRSMSTWAPRQTAFTSVQPGHGSKCEDRYGPFSDGQLFVQVWFGAFVKSLISHFLLANAIPRNEESTNSNNMVDAFMQSPASECVRCRRCVLANAKAASAALQVAIQKAQMKVRIRILTTRMSLTTYAQVVLDLGHVMSR